MKIAASYHTQLTKQEYQEKQLIEGVEIVPLTLNTDDGGNFLEVFRLSNQAVEKLSSPFIIKQVSMSVMMPGVVKAYHLHEKQDDLWFVPPQHRLLVNLHDLREDSNTYDKHLRLVLGGGKAQLLRIPTGVAHGAKNSYSSPMFLFYATSEQFNPAAPDELRLPWNTFGEEVWELQKG